MERELPYNLEAEQGVLGSLIIDPDVYDLIADRLHAEDFYRDSHRNIYAVVAELADKGIPSDYITLCDELERQNKLHSEITPGYISSLINGVPTSGNVEYYADLVARAALNRRIIHASGRIAALAYAQQDDALEESEKLLFAVAPHSHRDFSTAGQVVDDVLSDLDALYRQERSLVGVPTGFVGIDHYLGGMQRSDLLIVAGRPGMGKSSYMLSIAYHAAIRENLRVAIFSLEMSKKQLMQRLLSYDTHVDLYRLRNGHIQDHEWDLLMASRERLHTDRMHIDDTGGITLAELRAKARRLHAQQGLDLLIVDYLQLMHADSHHRNGNREQEVAQISTGLKELAKELDIPVMALAQLSRAVESRATKVPQLSDLRESGAIENDADVIQFLYRPGYYDPEASQGQADIIIAKHRNGPVGTVSLRFVANETRFCNPLVVVA